MSTNYAEITDKLLINHCIDGDQVAFHTLVQRYSERCYWTAYKYVHNVDDAEDITQDAFLKAFNMLRKFDTDRNFFTWLYKIIINTSIDFLRKKKQHFNTSIDEIHEIIPDERCFTPDYNIEQDEETSWVYRILHQIPEPYKAVLILREIEGKCSKDIGEILNVPHATVRWRLHHARKIFKDLWVQQYDKADNPSYCISTITTEN